MSEILKASPHSVNFIIEESFTSFIKRHSTSLNVCLLPAVGEEEEEEEKEKEGSSVFPSPFSFGSFWGEAIEGVS